MTVQDVTILAIDDEDSNIMVLNAILESEPGIKLHTTLNGSDGLKYLLNHEVALVLLDVQMPELDGFAVAKLMKGKDSTKHIPIIFLTAGTREQEQVFHAYNYGGVDYLLKPINPAILRGKVRVFVNLFRQKKIVSESEEKYSNIFQNSNDAIFFHDFNGFLKGMNSKAEEQFGYSKSELLEKNFRVLFTPEKEQDIYEYLKIVEEKGTFRCETDLQNNRGQRFNAELSSSVVSWSGEKVINTMVRDITARIVAEQKVIAANKTKSQFLANMSHEIRTPLNGIIGTLSMLALSELTTDQNRLVNSMTVSSDALLTIINDILDISKIEAGHLEIEKIEASPTKIIEEAIELYSATAAQKNLELGGLISEKIPQWIKTDPIRLRQIVCNLVGNSVKFTESGFISLTADVESKDEEYLLKIVITDSGIGMRPDTVKKLFTNFFQADTSTMRKFGGTGLGLAISHQLTTLLGGELLVDSQYGKGSTFTILLPINPSTGQAAKKIPKKFIGLNAVICDDSNIYRTITKAYLRELGFKVNCAENIDQAYDLLLDKKNKPNLVVIDIVFGKASVLDFILKLKEKDSLTKTKLLFITSRSSKYQEFREQVSRITSSEIMHKPLFKEGFSNQIKALFGLTDKISPHLPQNNKGELCQLTKEKAASLKILIAEDSAINQTVLRAMFTKLGCTIDLMENGRQAVEAVHKQDYDIIFMDCQMPEMDGVEATKAIRTLTSHKRNVPIIALTANALKGDKELYFAAGMDDYLSKPAKIQQIGTMLAKWVSEKDLERIFNEQNWKELKSTSELNLKQIVKSFIENARSFEQNTKLHLHEEKFDLIYRYWHKLKGEADALGATVITEKLINLMSRLRKESPNLVVEDSLLLVPILARAAHELALFFEDKKSA